MTDQPTSAPTRPTSSPTSSPTISQTLAPSNSPTDLACVKKCTGTNACQTLSQTFIDTNIAEGSCCGYMACNYFDLKNNSEYFASLSLLIVAHFLTLFFFLRTISHGWERQLCW